jgi:hypothetical protein
VVGVKASKKGENVWDDDTENEENIYPVLGHHFFPAPYLY